LESSTSKTLRDCAIDIESIVIESMLRRV
jgi:hypothetical protein